MLDSNTIRTAARESASSVSGRPITDGQKLISSGLIDSLSVLKLIGELESRLKVEIPTGSLQPDDFDDVELIVETVQRVARATSDREQAAT